MFPRCVTLCRKTDLTEANLFRANLSKAELFETDLRRAELTETDLSGANLTWANLSGADLSEATFNEANLTMADLRKANLVEANLSKANFSGTRFYHTTFAWIDLDKVKGLERARHSGPSTVNINSVVLPAEEHIRRHFLRGVGWTSTQIEYLPSLLRPRPIEYCSIFISYAHQDETAAKQLYTDLRKNDVPCWFAPHDLRPGTPILRGIEEAIHMQEKFLLVLSKHAVNSAWIEREVDAVLHQEIKRGKDVLFPIRLDNAVLESHAGWALRLQHRHIGDFTILPRRRCLRTSFLHAAATSQSCQVSSNCVASLP